MLPVPDSNIWVKSNLEMGELTWKHDSKCQGKLDPQQPEDLSLPVSREINIVS